MMVAIVSILSMLITGCFRTAKPNLFNGNYYMSGDSACASARALSDTRILCIDTDGKETGYRDAMTNQQLEMYRFEQQELSESIRRAGEAWAPKRTTTTTNCYRIGGMLSCSSF